MDQELKQILDELSRHEDFELRVGDLCLRAFTQVCGGRAWETLNGNTKTILGSEIENFFKVEFGLPNHDIVDTMIAGHPVDIKATSKSNWQIRPPCFGHWLVLFQVNPKAKTVSMGLFKAHEPLLSKTGGSQFKRQISREGRATIHWLVRDRPLAIRPAAPKKPIVFDETRTGKIEMRLWFDGVERPDVVSTILKDGRFTSHIVEHYAADHLGSAFALTNAKGYDFRALVPDCQNVEVKQWTKSGVNLTLSGNLGMNREKTDPVTFATVIAPSKNFIVADQTKLATSGEIVLVYKKGTDVAVIGKRVSRKKRHVLFGDATK